VSRGNGRSARRAARGAGLLITVSLVLVVAAFAIIVASSFSGSSIRDAAAYGESTEALYLAETAIERALKRFATGTACASLTDASAIELISGSGKTFQITKAATTDFSGTAFTASLTQCRVEAEGKAGTNNTTRRVQAILDKNLLGGADNEDFNNPAAAGAPSGWTLDPATSFANNGGPDGTAPACTRSAWIAKEGSGAAAGAVRTGSGTRAVSFTVTAGSTTTISYHRRNVTAGTGCASTTFGGTYPCGGTNDGTVCFQANGAGGPWTSSIDDSAATAVGGACPQTFNPCSSSYFGAPTKISLTMTMTGASSVTSFAYYMRLRNTGRKEMFIDNIEAVNNTAVGAARVIAWRDCSVASCP
jgi:hypothetical protein